MSNATVCLSTQTVTHFPEGNGDIELLVNMNWIPPHSKLSRQSNRDEEFAYILDGFIVLHHENNPDEFYKKGDVGKIPIDKAHNVSTQEEGATILIFSIQ